MEELFNQLRAAVHHKPASAGGAPVPHQNGPNSPSLKPAAPKAVGAAPPNRAPQSLKPAAAKPVARSAPASRDEIDQIVQVLDQWGMDIKWCAPELVKAASEVVRKKALGDGLAAIPQTPKASGAADVKDGPLGPSGGTGASAPAPTKEQRQQGQFV